MRTDQELASKLTDKQIDNVLNTWENDGEDKVYFNCLVSLGETRHIAMASILNMKTREYHKVRQAL